MTMSLFDHPQTNRIATQSERLLRHLEHIGPINPLESWRLLGIYRLGARIFDLREQGHTIETRRITVTSRFGDKANVAEYRLVRKAGTNG